jgi:hypothetical protein
MELYRIELRERQQKTYESLPELGQNIRRLTNLAYPTVNSTGTDYARHKETDGMRSILSELRESMKKMEETIKSLETTNTSQNNSKPNHQHWKKSIITTVAEGPVADPGIPGGCSRRQAIWCCLEACSGSRAKLWWGSRGLSPGN